jgi:antitoxin MazE
MEMATVTLKKWGNSPSIRIPASIMQAAALHVEDKLDLKINEEGQIVLIPVKTQEYSLDSLLSSITPENLHEKITFGAPIGKELL